MLPINGSCFLVVPEASWSSTKGRGRARIGREWGKEDRTAFTKEGRVCVWCDGVEAVRGTSRQRNVATEKEKKKEKLQPERRR